MLKIILCAYSQSVFSGRKIEALLKDSIRMMWLAQGYEPSYRTINRFRVDPDVKDLLRQLFVQFRCQLVEEKVIDNKEIFIDGTKIEKHFFNLPDYIVADAGYGSEQNCHDVLENRKPDTSYYI